MFHAMSPQSSVSGTCQSVPLCVSSLSFLLMFQKVMEETHSIYHTPGRAFSRYQKLNNQLVTSSLFSSFNCYTSLQTGSTVLIFCSSSNLLQNNGIIVLTSFSIVLPHLFYFQKLKVALIFFSINEDFLTLRFKTLSGFIAQ